ncbi:glycoside hydrolase family 3 N-terminal domain-containing protein [Siansivirga zeaxanthinifaciens]|uniref:Beta-glucosidase n=1 Tax=Siansivirga zeaxanthinifaciens CC-SAMT-1 TaxID=1454006 RepID=A0A0C5WNK5_9FLAO|nr:glycoside hydrolase family 3 N-terminal domain-containing protein [Siansivirga zeaxanthinifaciens]AJR04485.1 beta-glucosidase [Siansivirga zeaxanthinifaciens CC-SAMT-1]
MNKYCLVFFVAFQFVGWSQSQSNCDTKPWLNSQLSYNERVELLIGCLTFDEKVSQLLNASDEINRYNIKAYDWWNEALHGLARSAKATIFPQAIGMAATFDRNLIQEVGSTISDEARAVNNYLIKNNGDFIRYMGLTFWSPNVNIFRDPRWGRGQETYGEDPFLSGQIGASFIKGMQGDNPKYLKTAACAKHFAVHSGPEAERHQFNAIVNQQDLYETYLPAFKACIDVGVEAVMCAYNRTNNEACCGSPTLLQSILRGDWGFQGHIVSDCGALKNFHQRHGLTNSPEESAALALKSGTNLNCGNTYKKLGDAYEKGLVTEEDLNNALRPLLKTRFKLGMFDSFEDNPYATIGLEEIHSKENIDLARKVAQKSIVLLKNNGVLPLKKDIKQLYLSGPLVGDIRTLIGNYYGLNDNLVTLLEGVMGKVSPITSVQYRAGTLINHTNNNNGDDFSYLASKSDATIIGLGLTIVMEGEENEAIGSIDKGDNISMALPENQMAYLRKMRGKHNKPLIGVVFAGCPLDLTEVSELVDALIYAWYPGEQGGNAIADVIFGDISPSGKLPITFPKNIKQLPPYNDYSMKGRTYKYMLQEPQYPFGFGLTYSNIKIDSLTINSKTIQKNESQLVEATLTNSGNFKIEEVIQLYVSLKGNTEGVPLCSLKNFKRVNLEPNESVKMNFLIDANFFNYIDKKGKNKKHKGLAEIIVGNASPSKRSETLGATIKTINVNVK